MAKASIAPDWLGQMRVLQPYLAQAPDPHAELMAMVWGPRFDRAHAMDFLLQGSPVNPDLLLALTAAADQFDTLQASHQQRLRRLIMTHRVRHVPGGQAVDNADHAKNFAH